jgi:hypothetical protein
MPAQHRLPAELIVSRPVSQSRPGATRPSTSFSSQVSFQIGPQPSFTLPRVEPQHKAPSRGCRGGGEHRKKAFEQPRSAREGGDPSQNVGRFKGACGSGCNLLVSDLNCLRSMGDVQSNRPGSHAWLSGKNDCKGDR